MRQVVWCVGWTASIAAAAAPAYFAPGTPPWWPQFVGSHRATLLDGTWDFGFAEDGLDDVIDATVDAATGLFGDETTKVPSTADAAPPGVPGPRRTFVYRRAVELSATSSYRLQLMGCAFYCKVWLDGALVGANLAGGYAPFVVDVPAAASEKNASVDLVVLADNRFNDTSAPLHTGGDFWHFGGLVRSVVLHEFPNTNEKKTPVVWRAYVAPLLLPGQDEDENTWALNVTVALTARDFSGALNVSMAFDWDDDDATTRVVALDFEDGVARTVLADDVVPSTARAWTLRDPALHTVSVTTAVDSGGGGVRERFGLRAWSAVAVDDATRLALNGAALATLTGYNHHTQWPDATAMSPSDADLDRDIGLLARAGATYVRGAHYPQDQRWLDRLDELGVAMWEEALGPGVSVENLADEAFMQLQLEQLDQMVAASFNHPSIMTWGFFNEGPSEDASACAAYAAMADRLKALDASRFVTWASNKETNDQCLAHASLVAFNSYPAWYSDPGNLTAPRAHWTSVNDWIADAIPDKPFVVSETGAGGIYEWDNATDPYWSLNYQNEILGADVEAVLDQPRFSGLTIWHLFDFKGNDGAQDAGPCDYVPDSDPPVCAYIDTSVSRPGGLNHKGVVDYWRRPKPAFDLVTALYRDANEAPSVAAASSSKKHKGEGDIEFYKEHATKKSARMQQNRAHRRRHGFAG